MNKKVSRLLMSAILLAAVCNSIYADETSDYRKFAEETREWVYSMDLPAFKVREIPEKYKNESAVYLAVYNGLSVIKNTNTVRLPGTIRIGRDKHIEGGDLQRMLVYINDKAALDEFKEFDYKTVVTRKYDASQRKHRQVIGVKVIKPDGSENVVDSDDYVEVAEGKKNKDVRHKLAVPGLEVGDLVDIFIYVGNDIHNAHPDPMLFVLREEYPVMNYSVHWLIDGELATNYRLLNGAPDFTTFRDGDGNYHLDLELEDLPAKPRLYYDDMLQSPVIKLYIYNPNADGFMPKSSGLPGAHPCAYGFFIKKEWWDMKHKYIYSEIGSEFLRSSLKNGGKAVARLSRLLKNKEKSLVEVCDCAYNLMVFAHAAAGENISPIMFDMRLQSILEELVGDKLETVVTTASYNEQIDDLASLYSIICGSALPDGSRYYFPPQSFMAPSELHSCYSGRTAQRYPIKGIEKLTMASDSLFFSLPENKAKSNRKHCDIKVSLDGVDLAVKRRTSCTGVAKQPLMSLLSAEDITKAYLDYFEAWGLEIGIKESGKKAADRLARYADRRINQTEDFVSEVKDFHHDAATDSVKGTVVAVGVDSKSPRLVYEVEYNVRDLVKRAGKNRLLSIGRLAEYSGELLDRDRERHDFVTTKAAREYITRLEIALPEGSTVSGKSVENLNCMVRNPVGLFGVTARAEGGKLIVDVIKRFDHRFVPASSWHDMVELIEAASSWQARTVLIEN